MDIKKTINTDDDETAETKMNRTRLLKIIEEKRRMTLLKIIEEKKHHNCR